MSEEQEEEVEEEEEERRAIRKGVFIVAWPSRLCLVIGICTVYRGEINPWVKGSVG